MAHRREDAEQQRGEHVVVFDDMIGDERGDRVHWSRGGLSARRRALSRAARGELSRVGVVGRVGPNAGSWKDARKGPLQGSAMTPCPSQPRSLARSFSSLLFSSHSSQVSSAACADVRFGRAISTNARPWPMTIHALHDTSDSAKQGRLSA